MDKKHEKTKSQCLKLTALHEVSIKVKFKQVRDIKKHNYLLCTYMGRKEHVCININLVFKMFRTHKIRVHKSII